MLDIFGTTIGTWWNSKNDKLKNDLMNYMVILFGDTFNRKGVTATTGLNLKYVKADYRDNFQLTLTMSILRWFQRRSGMNSWMMQRIRH